VGIFSFDKPSLLIRDQGLVKNILVKDFHKFMGPLLLIDEKFDPLLGKMLTVLKGSLWHHLRTNLTPVFSSRKMKVMFCLLDTCGNELADCVEKATADGNCHKTSNAIKCTGKLNYIYYRISRDIILAYN
jgi:hypothetical protein